MPLLDNPAWRLPALTWALLLLRVLALLGAVVLLYERWVSEEKVLVLLPAVAVLYLLAGVRKDWQRLRRTWRRRSASRALG